MIFFVLSGFFIARSVFEDDRRKGFSWPIYLIKRVTRLWIVLIPCLILTFLLDTAGMSISGMAFYGGHLFQMYSSGPDVATTGAVHLEPSTFFGNLLFLQTILVPLWGSNGPLWSLSNEFWYYLMFPLLYLTFAKRRNLMSGAINLGLFAIACAFVGPYMVAGGLIWLSGAISFLIYDLGWLHKRLHTVVAVIITTILLLIALAASKFSYGTDFTRDLFIGLAAAAWVTVLASFNQGNAIYYKCARALAESSYTIYLVHFPFLALLANVVLMNRKFDASAVGYSLFFGLGFITLLYCYLIYWLFERHTPKIRKYCLTKYREAVGDTLYAAGRPRG